MGVDDDSWLLDSDEVWATEAIDDTQTLINLVEKAASEVLGLQPDDDLANQCFHDLKVLGDDGWPKNNIEIWDALAMRLVKIIPDSEIAKALKTTIIRYSEKHLKNISK
ncbi:MAG: hypothetical protein ACOYBW_05380 [Fluviibacter phosphoraccumulans]